MADPLTDEHREFIVKQLAMFIGPARVAKLVMEHYGISIPRQRAEAYDPTSFQGRKKGLAQKWRVLFHATRKAYLEEIESIPIASPAYRLRRLGEMESEAREAGNKVLAAALIEQAAKEVGGLFTNQRKHTHDGSVKLEAPPAPEELAGLLTDKLRMGMEARETQH